MNYFPLLMNFILNFWISRLCVGARVDMTFFGTSAKITSSQGILIFCLDSLSADGDIVQEFGRVVNTGTGATGTGASGPSDYGAGTESVAVPAGSGLPSGSIKNNRYFLGHYLDMPSSSSVERVGVFYCDTTTTDERNDETRIQHILLAENAVIKPLKLTVTIMPGETATLEVETTSGSSSGLKWLFHGGLTFPSSCDDHLSCDVSEAGIYECYYEGERDLGLHGIMRVIVRGCPAEMWEPASGCDKVCVECINGGVCDDQDGDCICPPGFHGTHCEETCGFNAVGPTCGIACSGSIGCRERYLCLPDPYGCSCTAGYQGEFCTTACDSNHFGADCALDCHCASGGCHQYTGVCDSGVCANGWSGHNCQYISPIVVSFTNVKVNSGEQTNFTCVIEAYPRPLESQITIAISSSPSLDIISLGYTDNLDNRQVTVTSNNVTVSSGQEYTCGVTSSAVAGVITQTITVDLFEQPVLLNGPTADVNDITATKVTIKWAAWTDGTDNGEGPIAKYEVYYGTSSPLMIGPEISHINDSVNEYRATISGLVPVTNYVFAIKTLRPGVTDEISLSPNLDVTTDNKDERVDVTAFSLPVKIASTTASEEIRLFCLTDAVSASDIYEQEFGRVINTGTGKTGTGAIGPANYGTGNKNTVTVSDDSGLPSGSTIENNGVFVGHLLRIASTGGAERIGAFYCDTTTIDGKYSRIQLIVLAEDADIKPLSLTLRANPGDSVIISMQASTNTDIRWLHNGVPLADCNDLIVCNINSVTQTSSGIYECYYDGQHESGKHGIVRLIVRGCPAEMWDPSSGCDKVCVECINGGVCDDQSGDCVCPPGFYGTHCEQTCGFNAVGPTCGVGCSSSDGCKNRNLCLPDSYGCSCTAGYHGLSCELDCDGDYFGADCSLDCHCAEGNCDKYTGECGINVACATGWSGYNCQYTSSSILSFTNTEITSDENTIFTCVIEAYPRPLESQITIKMTSPSTGQSINFDYVIDPDNQQVTVTTNSVNVATDEVYTCEVIDSAVAGATSETISIEQPVLSSAPFVDDNNDVAATKVTVKWVPWVYGVDYGDGPIIKYEVYYGTSSSQLEIGPEITNIENGVSEYRASISGLVPNTSYVFAIKTHRPGQGGDGSLSPFLDVTTDDKDERVDMTVFSKPAKILSTTTSEQILMWCLTDAVSASDIYIQEFGRVIDTETGKTGTGAIGPANYGTGNKNPVSVSVDSGLPSGSTIENNGNFVGHLLKIASSGGAEHIGAFYCDTTTIDGKYSRIQLIMLAEDADIEPLSLTLRANPGDSVTISMQASTNNDVRWSHNGVPLADCNNFLTCNIDSVTQAASGIYECYYDGLHETGKHGIVRLLVRGCPAEMWNPSSGCDEVCPECINGGVCDDQSGDCVCPPGFKGTHCEQACGFNGVGPNCGIGCSSANGCKDRLFCQPDPYGCSCAAGHYGPTCESDCDSNHFGADCSLDCHCDEGDCDQYMGECGNSVACATGWSGHNCQYISSEVISFTNMKVNPNEQSTFTCVIKAYPRPLESQILMARTSPSSSSISFVYAIDPGNRQVIVTSSSVTVSSGEEFSCSVNSGAVAGDTSETITVDLFVLPILTSAPYANDSSIGPTFVLVTWREWQNGTDIGEGPIVKYELYYAIQGKAPFNFTKAFEVSVNSTLVETTNSYTVNSSLDVMFYQANISKLEADTEYIFAVKIYREGVNGGGNFSPFLNISTKCEVSATLLTVLVEDISTTMINLIWAEPENGSLCSIPLSYTVTYTLVNRDQCETTVDQHEPITTQNWTLVLENLIPHSTYDIAITSNTNGGKSQPYKLSVVTSSSVPGAVTNLGLINKNQTHLAFNWNAPPCGQINGEILAYNYMLTPVDGGENTVGETLVTNQGFNGLLIGTNYTFMVKCQTEVGFGMESHLFVFTLPNYESVTSPTSADPIAMGTIIGGVCAGFVVFLALIVVLIVFHQRRNKNKEKNEEQISPSSSNLYIAQSNKDHPSGSLLMNDLNTIEQSTTYENVVISSSMTLEKFVEYVLKSRKENQLVKEFQDLPAGKTNDWKVAQNPKIKAKNRYGNIIPYDHSRVVLEYEDDNPFSDYINASYIDGYSKKRAYIAAQGPNKISVNDMWRMIWQEKVSTILMATKCVENRKNKCECYWPLSGKQVYGDCVVTLENKEQTDNYDMNTFKIHKKGKDDSRILHLFQFLSWPDMGVPISVSNTLKFLKKVKHIHAKGQGPFLIHCSAGVGRTGTFMAMDILLDMMKAKGELDVFTCVKDMRKDRINMIQTKEQYVFLHHALLEEILCEDTAIPVNNFENCYKNLQSIQPDNGNNGFAEEFRKLQILSPVPNIEKDCELGSLPENLAKNRYPDISIDRTCPRLETIAKGSTDFIHANIVEKFLVTQMPLPHTMSDFWSLVYDYNSSTIVMLNDLNDADNQGQYWPDKGQAEYGPFTVELESETMWGSITLRSLNLWKTSDSNSVRSIQQFQVSDWPADNVAPARGMLTELLSAVDRWQQQSGDGPVTIHCIDGLGRSGIYCTVALSVDQIKVSQSVDVFDTVKTIRISRPGMIKSLEEYILCYENLLNYIGSFETYANFI